MTTWQITVSRVSATFADLDLARAHRAARIAAGATGVWVVLAAEVLGAGATGYAVTEVAS